MSNTRGDPKIIAIATFNNGPDVFRIKALNYLEILAESLESYPAQNVMLGFWVAIRLEEFIECILVED